MVDYVPKRVFTSDALKCRVFLAQQSCALETPLLHLLQRYSQYTVIAGGGCKFKVFLVRLPEVLKLRPILMYGIMYVFYR